MGRGKSAGVNCHARLWCVRPWPSCVGECMRRVGVRGAEPACRCLCHAGI